MSLKWKKEEGEIRGKVRKCKNGEWKRGGRVRKWKKEERENRGKGEEM